MANSPQGRNGIAFCWQEKATLRKIREQIPNYGSALAVYQALTVVASDKESNEFQTTQEWLAQLAGFGWRTVLERLKDLQHIGVVEINTPRLRGPSTYRLCRSALFAGRPAIIAERSAKIEARPLQTSEEKEEKKEDSPSAEDGKARPVSFTPCLKELHQQKLAEEIDRHE